MADVGRGGGWREHEHDGIGVADEAAEAMFPILAAGDAVSVDGGGKAVKRKRRIELIREFQVVTTVRNKDAELAGIVRSHACPPNERISAQQYAQTTAWSWTNVS